MGLIQYIYTSILGADLSGRQAWEAAVISAGLCQKFGISGRVFANSHEAFAITEGPEEIVTRYFENVSRSPMAATVLLHSRRVIPAREFEGFSILLNVDHAFVPSREVQPLNTVSYNAALPDTISSKVRILAKSYMNPDMLKG